VQLRQERVQHNQQIEIDTTEIHDQLTIIHTVDNCINNIRWINDWDRGTTNSDNRPDHPMFQTPAISPAGGLPNRERLQALVAISVAVAMATLDAAVTNTALPAIAGDVGSDGASAIWIINAYQLVMVAALLPLASLGEIAGHRRVYIAGLLLFTAASLACGLSWSLPTLVAARALQGLGAAAIMSVNTALIRFIYPAKMLGRGVGLNALVVALAFTIGPTVASAILSMTDWHWLFLINVPAGLIAIGLSLRTLPETGRASHRFDAPAAMLCAGFFALIIFGLAAITHGSGWPVIAAEWMTAIVCGYALLRREAGRSAPMLAVDLAVRTDLDLLLRRPGACLRLAAVPSAKRDGSQPSRNRIPDDALACRRCRDGADRWPVVGSLFTGAARRRRPSCSLRRNGEPRALAKQSGRRGDHVALAALWRGFRLFPVPKPESVDGKRTPGTKRRRQRHRRDGAAARPKHWRRAGRALSDGFERQRTGTCVVDGKWLRRRRQHRQLSSAVSFAGAASEMMSSPSQLILLPLEAKEPDWRP
jgi:MFS family permease